MLRDAYCRTLGIEYMHIQDPEQKRWIQQHVEGVPDDARGRRAAPHPRPAERGRGLRAVPAHPLRRPEALRPRRRGVDHRRCSTPCSTRRPAAGIRGRHGHGPPRPAERARQHRRQVLRRDLRGVRGRPRPRIGPGLGRREVPQGRRRQVHRARRARAYRSRWRRTRRTSRRSTPSSRAWRGPSRTGSPPTDGTPMVLGVADLPVLSLLVHGDAAFAGQGVVAETLELSLLGLPHRRHRPRGHQQPARLHHRARVGPVVGVPDRRGQDGPGPDLPRERRRSRGVRAGGAAGLRLPAGVPQGRRDRPRLLPAPRPQRGGRPELHPAAHVPASTPSARCASSTPRRSCAGATSRWTRPSGPSTTSTPGCRRPWTRSGPSAAAARRDCRRRRAARRRPSHRWRPGSTPRRPASRWPPHRDRARGLHDPPEARPAVRPAGRDGRRRPGRLGARRGARLRHPAARGRRRPAHRPGHPARHLQPAPRRARRLRDRRRVRPAGPSPGRVAGRRTARRSSGPLGRFTVHDSLLSEYAALGFEYGYSVEAPTPWSPGRRSSATSSTAPRSSSTTSSWPPRTSGASTPGSSCCSPTATRARAPSTPRPASSGS